MMATTASPPGEIPEEISKYFNIHHHDEHQQHHNHIHQQQGHEIAYKCV